MTRWIAALLIIGLGAVTAWCPAEATDHPVHKSLMKAGTALQVGYARTCVGRDLAGDWELVTFDSPYRFRNPRAPYLFPHQVFQYTTHGGAKSAHSRRPIQDSPGKVLQTVPMDMTYEVRRSGRVILKATGHDEPKEIWSCQIATRDFERDAHRTAVRRGDLLMTLLGSEGKALFVRQLRKSTS